MTLRASWLEQLGNPSLTVNQRAELRCEAARELEDKGEYEAASEALGELWRGVGERPNVEGLDRSAAAEVILRAGVLTGWLGSISQIENAQESAKNLISESVRLFESHSKKALEARTELAFCYWREGGHDEARVILKDVLERLTADSELKAKAVLRSAIVEWATLRYHDSLCILSEAAPLFEKIKHHTIKGGYHNALAGVLEDLGASERREDYTDRAFVEYAAARYHFEQAGHRRYLANVENNLGFLYFKVGRYGEAGEHLENARRLLVILRDGVTIAQVDETRARVFIAQGRHSRAEKVARSAVRALEKADRQSLLAEVLTTHGIALARLGYHEQARFVLYRAIEVAHQSGALNDAGLAALTVVEEIGESLSAEEMLVVYRQAYQWLFGSQHLQTLQRLLSAANRVLTAFGRPQTGQTPEAGARGTLKESMLRYEKEIVRQALRASDGSVTQAADLLGVSYQSLVYMLGHRHPDLLPERTPVIPRRRNLIKPD